MDQFYHQNLIIRKRQEAESEVKKALLFECPVILEAEEYNELISIKRENERRKFLAEQAAKIIKSLEKENRQLKEELEEKQVMLDTQQGIIDRLKDEKEILEDDYRILQDKSDIYTESLNDIINQQQRELETQQNKIKRQGKKISELSKELQTGKETDHLEADVFRYVFGNGASIVSTNEKAELFEAPSQLIWIGI